MDLPNDQFEEYQKQASKMKESVRKQNLRQIYLSILMTMVSNTPDLLRKDAQEIVQKAYDLACWADTTWATNNPEDTGINLSALGG